jgi:hypothetical protein
MNHLDGLFPKVCVQDPGCVAPQATSSTGSCCESERRPGPGESSIREALPHGKRCWQKQSAAECMHRQQGA